MMFEELTIHNVGVYRGEHRISLATTPSQPVVLIGALNGSGKTTLLEAMQLALFGRAATGTSRGASSYPGYLSQLINRDVDPKAGASVSLRFKHRTHGRDEAFQVTRTWRQVGSAVKESLEVLRDGSLDLDATERWLEHVEQFLPVQLADLFLFDGERIEGLADPERAKEFLRTGIHALLGLDLVDHLCRSLATLERRKQSDSVDLSNLESAVVSAETDLQSLMDVAATKKRLAATLRTDIDGLECRLKRVNRTLEKEGGELFLRRDQIATELDLAARALDVQAELLGELASGEAPLWLVSDLLGEARDLASSARETAVARRVFEVLESRDAHVKQLLGSGKAGAAVRTEILKFLDSDTQEWARRTASEAGVHLDLEGFAAVTDESREEILKSIQGAMAGYAQSREAVSTLKLKMASIPEADAIKVHLDAKEALNQERATCRAKLELIEQELSDLGREMERAQKRLESVRGSLNAAALEDSVDHRIVVHARRAGTTLVQFRREVVARNVRRVEILIADRFKTLLRKGSHLISTIEIDQTDFGLRLRDSDNRAIEPMTLSAGERQLLAVAIVWALAKASGRSLPTVIDTPLGRLDGKHRTNLVENYFPAASHQVILLSTDEEVNGRYYRQLRPFVAREYLLSYDLAKRSSAFEEGYFEQISRAVA